MCSKVEVEFLSIHNFLSFQGVFKNLLSALLFGILATSPIVHNDVEPSVLLHQGFGDLKLARFDKIHIISGITLSVQVLTLDGRDVSELISQFAKGGLGEEVEEGE